MMLLVGSKGGGEGRVKKVLIVGLGDKCAQKIFPKYKV